MSRSVRRHLLTLHRWLGLGCALFLLVLCLTGLALNHNARLGLDRIHLRADWILDRYGMVLPRPDSSVELKGHHAAVIAGELWWQGAPRVPLETIAGAVAWEGFALVASDHRVALLSDQGELVDVLDLPAAAGDERIQWGTIDAWPAARTSRQIWALDDDLAGWISGPPGTWVASPVAIGELPEAVFREWKIGYSGAGLSAYRVLLDLHAGRFFGLPGTLLMDLTALAVIYLVASGVLASVLRRRGKRG